MKCTLVTQVVPQMGDPSDGCIMEVRGLEMKGGASLRIM